MFASDWKINISSFFFPQWRQSKMGSILDATPRKGSFSLFSRGRTWTLMFLFSGRQCPAVFHSTPLFLSEFELDFIFFFADKHGEEKISSNRTIRHSPSVTGFWLEWELSIWVGSRFSTRKGGLGSFFDLDRLTFAGISFSQLRRFNFWPLFLGFTRIEPFFRIFRSFWSFQRWSWSEIIDRSSFPFAFGFIAAPMVRRWRGRGGG